MSHINLRYIRADYLTEILARPDLDLSELADELTGLIQNDYALALGYIEKYDNPGDRLETNVDELKSQIDTINANLAKLRQFYKK